MLSIYAEYNHIFLNKSKLNITILILVIFLQSIFFVTKHFVSRFMDEEKLHFTFDIIVTFFTKIDNDLIS